MKIQNMQSKSFLGNKHKDAWGVSQEKKKAFWYEKTREKLISLPLLKRDSKKEQVTSTD